MIQLHSDFLLIEISTGQTIPCSAERVTFELIGEAAPLLDKQLIEDAAAAVLHYFKVECQRDYVTVSEFSLALERVLKQFGVTVQSDREEETASRADLRELAAQAGKGFELVFFGRLRRKLREMVAGAPQVVQFHGLRSCVKQLVGAQRWTPQCQSLNDQIVDYLRSCLGLLNAEFRMQNAEWQSGVLIVF